MDLDVLAFGVHPDDAELGVGAFLALEVSRGRKCGIVDLTRGEMATNGDEDIRLAEAEEAAQILGLEIRRNLALRDRALDKNHLPKIVAVLRELRPRLVLAPYWEDRHPDHGDGSKLIDEAIFDAGLAKYCTDLAPWKVKAVWHYFINSEALPSFVVDVSPMYGKKLEALHAHKSQFSLEGSRAKTRLNSGMLYYIENRDRLYGAKAGVEFAEGFLVKQTLLMADPFAALGGMAE